MTPEGIRFIDALPPQPRMGTPEWDAWMQADMAERMDVADELVAKDPLLGPMGAITMAGDILSLRRAQKWVADGCPAIDAMVFVGSFGRLQFLLWAYENGHLPEAAVFNMLPDQWRSGDPDDTDPRYLRLWRLAKAANRGVTICDKDPLPRGWVHKGTRTRMLTAYRGQDPEAPLGIAWTLDEQIAEKFARGAGTRQSNRGGTVFETYVPRAEVLAYLTMRGESEVILPTVGTDYLRKDAL